MKTLLLLLLSISPCFALTVQVTSLTDVRLLNDDGSTYSSGSFHDMKINNPSHVDELNNAMTSAVEELCDKSPLEAYKLLPQVDKENIKINDDKRQKAKDAKKKEDDLSVKMNAQDVVVTIDGEKL